MQPLCKPPDARVAAPPSKSYTHRALVLAFLAGEGRVARPLWGQDTLATRSCLATLGATITGRQVARVARGPLEAPGDVLDVENSGTTLRLLTGVCGLLEGASVLTGDASIRARPMEPLLDALRQLGARASSTRGNGCAPVVVQGPLRGGEARLPGDVSSQFVSALLLAGPLAAKDVRVALSSPLRSRPYVDATLALLRHYGVRVEEGPHGFDVPGGQAYARRSLRVPGDWSSAAFPLVAAAITGGRVRVAGLSSEWPQGDRAIVTHLRAMGARVREGAGVVALEAAGLEGAELDLGDTPDLFPALCVAGACARGTTLLGGAPHLRFKESDRIRAMAQGLRRMGARVRELPDGLVVQGGRGLRGASIATHGDHRILMAFAVAALAARGPVRLSEHGSFAVSYPGFLDDLLALGARVEVGP